MAAQTFQTNHEISRQEIQAAIAKAVELRALHAALVQGNSPANLRFPPPSCSSPSLSRSSNQFSAEDYPVFTPSYEEEPLPGYHHIRFENKRLSEIWSGAGLQREEEEEEEESDLSDNIKASLSSRKGLASGLSDEDHQFCAVEDCKPNKNSCANHITVLQTYPEDEIFKLGTQSGLEKLTTCNTCKPATISRSTGNDSRNAMTSKTVVPVSDSQPVFQPHSKSKGPILSRLFLKLRKKPKAEASPTRAISEDASQFTKEWGTFSIESLKKELIEANEKRDAALMESAEMKSSLGEMKQKLAYLETYYDEMKKALKQAMQGKEIQVLDQPPVLTKRSKSINGSRESSIPIIHEAMVEGFLQMVSEARISVKHFSKCLICHIDQKDDKLIEKLNTFLEPHNLTLQSKYSKGLLYHLEAVINQSLHQDFENCRFQRNGSRKVLDPHEDRQAKYAAFVSLRNLSWNEVLSKGTKYYSEEFSRFCDEKMSCIVSTLNWSRPWPEELLQSFFVAAKCIWLLHLLAFSFSPPLEILRVDENRSFDPLYMEDILLERQRSELPAKVKIMVMPGFYVKDKVLKCKVLCRYKKLV